MTFREKIAWLSLVALGVAYVPYFAVVASGMHDLAPMPNFPLLVLLAAVSALRLAILGGGWLLLRNRAPEDARVPPDERDTAIAQRAMASAYYVLTAGMILVGCIMPFTEGAWKIVNSAIFMLVIAETVQHAVVAVSYRRQA
ncbi:MAG: hypothetical protein IV086_11740 [Hyphomonadaceae bacterium]|nr:MAG: hypothetical protein FD160_2553 [Caulobacteraceae bacterium]MBT9446362.1 hypothetical protein [Hyphomonadaceae bacterium]TPW03839.1 MAG: hypothetical protein FD124_2850 [Alphaproteobacteria bacterium]